MGKLSVNQKAILQVMGQEVSRNRWWWTTSGVRKAWLNGSSPAAIGLGMALRGLWIRGLVERKHGPPAAYTLTKAGRMRIMELQL